MASRQPATNIPITDFYGESTTWPVADTLHCEQLRLRSAMYDWQIKPHRHMDLMQIFYVVEGSGLTEVDNRKASLRSGDLLVVPQQCVHTFRWEEGSNGYVLFIARPLLVKLEHILGPLHWAHEQGSRFSTGNLSQVQGLFTEIFDEYQAKRAHREIVLENLILSLFVWINRQHLARSKQSAPISRSVSKVEQFNNLLDEYLNQQHKVEWYAREMGITAAHLNSLCKKTLGQNALAIIHDRLLSEAQRNLIYTAKTAAEVAETLGFSDPAYFNRFFKHKTGLTPKSFRHQRP